MQYIYLYSFLDVENPGLPKQKAYKSHKVNVTQNQKLPFKGLENTEGNRKTVGSLRFLLFQQCFQTLSSAGG